MKKVIGTFNLDPRSANLNTECITVIFSENITKSPFFEKDLFPS